MSGPRGPVLASGEVCPPAIPPDPPAGCEGHPPEARAMRHELFVYLSGPITPKDGALAEEHVAAGLRVHLDLLRRGIPNFCPQLCGAFPSAWSAVPYDVWLAYDLAVLDRCTHVLMLPGWAASRGACIEKAYAEARGLPVLFDLEALPR